MKNGEDWRSPEKMKRYLMAVALGTLAVPPLGATIYGSLMGNPFIISFPAVLVTAYLLEGLPAIVFGIVGSILHRNGVRNGRHIAPLAAATYGMIVGAMCGSIPMVLAGGVGHWTINRSIISFIAAGTITGLICALMGNHLLSKHGAANTPEDIRRPVDGPSKPSV